jgi:hypothetical protein
MGVRPGFDEFMEDGVRRSRGIQRTQSECFEEHLLAEFFPQDNHNYNDNIVHTENNDFLNLQNPLNNTYIKTEENGDCDDDLGFMKLTERKPYLTINIDTHIEPTLLLPPHSLVTPPPERY